MKALVVVFTCSALFVPLVFGTDPFLMAVGTVLWGGGAGGHRISTARRGQRARAQGPPRGRLWHLLDRLRGPVGGNVCTGLL
jgi:hypothetical protein